MAEEKDPIPQLNSEDVHALRVLLHAVRGLSVVSTANGATQLTEE